MITRHSVAAISVVAFLVSHARAQTPAKLIENRYEADPQHSSVDFTARMLGLVKVRGRFKSYNASIIYDPAAPERSSVTAIIATESIDTDMSFRDRHLKSPDFFDVEHFPTIEFQSDRVQRRGGSLIVGGTLTMHGVSKHVELPTTLALKPDTLAGSGMYRVAFETHLRVSRAEFGIAGTNKFNPSYDPASTLLADSVDVDIAVYAMHAGYRNRVFTGGKPPSIADTVSKVLAASGPSEAVKAYRDIRSRDSAAFNFSPGQLNALGHQLMERGKLDAAVALLQLNAESFPKVDGVSTSLGDALVLAGNVPGAIGAYERAVQANPLDAASAEMLRRLRATPSARDVKSSMLR